MVENTGLGRAYLRQKPNPVIYRKVYGSRKASLAGVFRMLTKI